MCKQIRVSDTTLIFHVFIHILHTADFANQTICNQKLDVILDIIVQLLTLKTPQALMRG